MTQYEQAIATLNERKAANRKALAEAQGRKDSAGTFAKRTGFASNILGNRGLHTRLIEVVGGMVRK